MASLSAMAVSSVTARLSAPLQSYSAVRRLARPLGGSRLLRYRSVARRRGGVACPTVAQAKSGDADSVGTAGVGAIAGGLVANPVVVWSLYTLKTTGCGLPPGPGGSLGAIEGVSYLVVLGMIGWSVYTKVRTGSGLPSGPFGLLGAVEGVSYLSLLAIAVVFGLQFLELGYVPGPLPGDQCFG